VNYLLLTPELFVTDSGIARILRLYLKSLCDLSGKDDIVRVVSLNDRIVDSRQLRRYSDKSLVEWVVCDRSRLKFVRATLRLARRSDRIVCGHIGQLPVAWLASKLRPRLSYYLIAHGIEVWRPFSFMERKALKGARCIFCVSDYTRRQLIERCPLPEERTAVLHNALDPHLDPASSLEDSGRGPTILSISRITIADSYKGLDHLVAAMPAVCAEIPEARLRIVGRGRRPFRAPINGASAKNRGPRRLCRLSERL
jgi:phosphatidylinositol alpha-1,6-mannosyltransferase